MLLHKKYFSGVFYFTSYFNLKCFTLLCTKMSEANSSKKPEESDINLNDIVDALDESVGVSLPFRDLHDFAKFIKYNKPENIIVLVGAGVSTSAGIPDFRSDSGIYKSLSKFKLRDPTDIFSLPYFRKNPAPFFEVAKKLLVYDCKPTLTHYFLRMLVEKGHVLRIYTQNIDMLEHLAGIDPDKIINAHGCHKTNTCLSCKVVYDQEYIEDHLRFGKQIVAYCKSCKNGVVKPDITFFGEDLPKIFHDKLEEDMPKADMLIIMGTSLKVYPVADIPGLVPKNVPRVLLNDEAVGYNMMLYNRIDNKRDFFEKGKIDDIIRELTKELGWLPDLQKMMEEENDKLTMKYKEIAERASKSSDLKQD